MTGHMGLRLRQVRPSTDSPERGGEYISKTTTMSSAAMDPHRVILLRLWEGDTAALSRARATPPPNVGYEVLPPTRQQDAAPPPF